MFCCKRVNASTKKVSGIKRVLNGVNWIAMKGKLVLPSYITFH